MEGTVGPQLLKAWLQRPQDQLNGFIHLGVKSGTRHRPQIAKLYSLLHTKCVLRSRAFDNSSPVTSS